MTGNISYLFDFEALNGGYVTFSGNPKGGKITGKGKIRTGKLDFDDVYFVKELKFNLFSISQMCDKKNSVLFTNTKCIVLSFDFRVLVTKPHNKTPYELLLGRTPSVGFTRPFSCPVTILNTLDPLGKFNGKVDQGFLDRYSVSSKDFRVFNSRTRIVQETLHINFLENQPNVEGSGPTWLFDIDTLTQSLNYQPVVVGNQPNSSADPQNIDADTTFEVKEPEYKVHVSPSSSTKTKKHDDKTKREATRKSHVSLSTGVRNLSEEFEDFYSNNTNEVNASSTPVTAVEPNSTNSTNTFSVAGPSNNVEEGIDYEEVFALVARIEDIWLFLAYTSFMGFMVYQMDVKSAFLYGTIEEEKFGLTDGKSASTPIDTEKPLLKDCDVKRIFRYLQGKPHLGLSYLKDSPFNLVAYSDSDYVGASLDRRKVIITEDTVRQALHMDDADSIDCVPNEEIFAELARMGLVRNVDSPSKFFMYSRFLQLMINAQIADLSSHNTKYTSLAFTQKVFANMRRVGKGFSVVDTLLFEGMLVPQQVQDNIDAAAEDEDSAEPTPPSPTPATTPPPQQELIPSSSQAKTTPPPSPHQSPITQPSSPPQQQPSQPSQTSDISMDLFNTLLETCTTLTRKVENLEQDKIAQALEITKLKQRVRRLEKKSKLKPSGLKRLQKVGTTQRGEARRISSIVTAATTITATPMTKASAPRRKRGVIIHDPEETPTPSVIVHSEPMSKDKRKGILVEEPKLLKRQAQIEQDDAYARELEAELNVNFNWNEVIEQHFNSIVDFLKKGEKEIKEEASKVIKRKSESSDEKVAEKQRLDEEVKELRTHLQIVPNDEDDVYIKATPLAIKVPIIDYQIHTDHNKPYYKIIRADGTHQLFLSFISLLRNFNREDLEML
nr:ribonuclease H-like domain-containing protein [Tanacetum cinerariifolium]